jgi:hypothetical protein
MPREVLAQDKARETEWRAPGWSLRLNVGLAIARTLGRERWGWMAWAFQGGRPQPAGIVGGCARRSIVTPSALIVMRSAPQQRGRSTGSYARRPCEEVVLRGRNG